MLGSPSSSSPPGDCLMGLLKVQEHSIVHSVVMTPATIGVVKGLENSVARALPELLDENARDQLAVGA
jgi:hypothetical protein